MTVAGIPAWNNKAYGGFVTVHIVFDLENRTMTYYANDGKTAIATCELPVDAKFFETARLELAANAKFTSYLKAIAVSHGNVTEYFE